MEFRTYYMAREWVRNGHRVCICAASYTHLRPEIENSAADYQEDGIDYVWVPTPSYSNNWSRGINISIYTLLTFLQIRKIASKVKPDIIIASSPHPFTVFHAWVMSKLYRVPWIYEVRDLWPLTMFELAKMSPYHPFLFLMGLAEKFGFKHSASTVSLLPTALDYMASKGLPEEKFYWIPTGISVKDWNSHQSALPSEHEELLQQLHAKNNFIVGYMGTMATANALQYLIHAAAKLAKEPSVAFVIVGSGPMKSFYVEMANALALKNVHFLPHVPRACLPNLLSRMDVLYIGLKRCGLYRYGTSTNKLCDYMMAGRPIIHGIETPFDVVEDAQCGVSISAENPDAIAEAVLKLKAVSRAELEQMGLNGHEYIRKRYDYEILARKMEDIMLSIIDTGVGRRSTGNDR